MTNIFFKKNQKRLRVSIISCVEKLETPITKSQKSTINRQLKRQMESGFTSNSPALKFKSMHASLLEITDESIVKGCCIANRESQKHLYEKYYDSLSWACMRYIKNQEEVNDLVHEGFIKIFKNIHKFSGKGSLEGWMKRIVINNCLDYLRKINRRQPDLPISEAWNLEGKEDVIANMEADFIIGMLQDLVPLYRMVFSLSVIEGYPHKEIAKTLKIKESTSRAYLTAAKREIREKLACIQ